MVPLMVVLSLIPEMAVENIPCLGVSNMVKYVDRGQESRRSERGGGGILDIVPSSAIEVENDLQQTGRCNKCKSLITTVQNAPKKRVLFYSFLLAILTCFIFSLNLLISFLTDLIREDKLWEYLKYRDIVGNHTVQGARNK